MQFDFTSIKKDLEDRLSLLSSWKKVLFYGVYSALTSAVSYIVEKLAFLADVYYRESNWASALKIKSLILQSKLLRYTPHRKIGADGEIDVSYDSTFSAGYVYSGTSAIINRWTPATNDDADTFVYVTETKTYYKGTSGVLSVPVKEGEVSTYTYTATGDKNEKVILTSASIDNDEIQIEIVNSLGANLHDVHICGSLSGTSASGYSVYYPEQLYFVTDLNEYYCEVETDPTFDQVNITFGDGVYGRKLTAGELIKFTYGVTSGDDGNITQAGIITKFSNTMYDANGNEITLHVTNSSEISNGSGNEDLEHIRNYGNRLFVAGYRAGGLYDWVSVLEDHPYIYKANVSNNEDLGINDSSSVNKVYITAISRDGSTLTDDQKTDVTLYLKEENKKCISEIVSWYDPVIIFLLFKINAFIEEESFTTLEGLIDTALTANYGILNVDFQKNVYESNYNTVIDNISYVDHHYTNVYHLEKNIAATVTLAEIAVSYNSSRTAVLKNQIFLQANSFEIWLYRKKSGVWDTTPYKIAEDQSGVIVGLIGDLGGGTYTITNSYLNYTANKYAFKVDTIVNDPAGYGVQNPGANVATGYILSIAYKTQDGNGSQLEDVRLPEPRCITNIDTNFIITTLEYI
jgi:hypothetical protein